MKKIKSLIGVVFLLVGLTLISIPLYYEWQQGKELKAMEEALSLISESNDEATDLSKIDNLTFTENELNGVLELEIPSIDLKQKVLAETTEKNLNVALTQIKRDQSPGEGNFAIAGHRGYRGDRHFRHLPDVSIGEKVYLHAEDGTYVYRVTSSKVIKPTNVEVLVDDREKKEITMITCTVSGENRIAVKGELIEIIKK
ncbi:class D sortase [Bacillus aquiflavi]|uniref:Class D sortase n=1 Tax=Bacillus aquiflavi TaxID=2672567 RepID=A0A6B3W3G7_9BACI|nr:class D sortase [Bacillus aquiflavi]MBA4538136.1 class D sortase [Bacillus aquiflavi]NEY82456.1 class D sortase [Bacillus aquiflavi]UAC48572.1 class D sortase [Bacillus aquiflavi]